jgi:hypothetical protein
LRGKEDLAVQLDHPLVGHPHRAGGADDEREVLEPGASPGVVAALGGLIEKEVGAALAAGRPVREPRFIGDEGLVVEQRQNLAEYAAAAAMSGTFSPR